ncbi:TPA: SDR family NAD(P)-dependent oxidoreductase [Candidatus Woesearchaeota archaeon]|nr:SDR family NAD(P)-dependent oxidoreductase [Candidatus Woesearchaeota archaeon]
MTSIKGKVVVITGASRGIGKAIADECLKKGAIVVIASRSKPQGRQAGEQRKAEHIFCDVTSSKSLQFLVRKVISGHDRIDILINNAAIGLFETIAASKEQDVRAIMETNVLAPLHLTQLVLPHMRQRKSGLIVNISSAIAKHSLYYQGVYSASKAALERLTEAIAIEEAGNGISALLIVPDRTKTAFRMRALGSKKNAPLPLTLPESDPSRVARTITAAIERGTSICYTSLRSRIFAYAAALSPGIISRTFRKEFLLAGRPKGKP